MGYFMVIEGVDGTGKSTLAHNLLQLMPATMPASLTHEPNEHYVAGDWIRSALAGKLPYDDVTMALAFAANRADHLRGQIRPNLVGGHNPVICDRYYLSSLVYQSGNSLTMEQVAEMNADALNPDLTILLDADPAVLAARVAKRSGKLSVFDTEFIRRRERYHEAADFRRVRGDLVVIVNANGDENHVLNSAIEVINHYAPEWMHLKAVKDNENA